MPLPISPKDKEYSTRRRRDECDRLECKDLLTIGMYLEFKFARSTAHNQNHGLLTIARAMAGRASRFLGPRNACPRPVLIRLESELLRKHALFEAVRAVEHHEKFSRTGFFNFDFDDVARFKVIGDRADRALIRFQHGN